MILSRSDLLALTGLPADRRVQARRVIAALCKMRIKYLIGADGWPKVLEDEVRRVMVGGAQGRGADVGALKEWQEGRGLNGTPQKA